MARPIVLVGGGGHCKSVIEAAESMGMKIKGILDLPHISGSKCLGYTVIGNDNDIPKYTEECNFVVTLGFIKNPIGRLKIADRIKQAGGTFETIQAKSANVSKHASIGDGSVILHNANVNAGAQIGKNCIINTGAVIEHDAFIGDDTHISTGALVNGDCKIGERCFIGSGAVVCNGVSITDGSIVGAGALVKDDITESGTYVGIPAKRIK